MNTTNKAKKKKNLKKILELKNTMTEKKNSLEGFRGGMRRQKQSTDKLEDRPTEFMK
jgi:hypothetical protein